MSSRSQLPARRSGRRGFSLLELLVVVAIIGVLTGLVASVILGVKQHRARVDARLSMQQMAIALANMKTTYEYDPSIPVGVYTGGQTTAGTADFTDPDPDRDFAADGIGAGDEIFILTDAAQSRRQVTARTGNVLTLSGAPFAKSERNLVYFVIRSNGELYPRVYPGRELDPSNKAWKDSFKPHLNARRITCYTCPAGRIRNGSFCDPWGAPYAYLLVPEGDVMVEKIACAGGDGKMGTGDDLEEVIAEIPFKP